MLECKFIYLDLFWDSIKNSGSIQDVNPLLYDNNAYWWKCYNCNTSYFLRLERMLLNFRMNKTAQLNNYCPVCRNKGCLPKYEYRDFLKYVSKEDKDFLSKVACDFLDKNSSAYTFYTYCPDCGIFHRA